MSEDETSYSRLVVAELRKPNMTNRLYHIAKWSTHSDADAKDLVADSLIRVLDPDDLPWIPKRTFLLHMTFVMRHVWDEQMRRVRVQREVLDGNLAQDGRSVSREPRADDELDRRRRLAVLSQLGERLLAQLRDDELATRVYELASRGIDVPREQAEQLGRTLEEVEAAIKRLRYRAKPIRDEWDAAEERRMNALRNRATTKMTEETP